MILEGTNIANIVLLIFVFCLILIVKYIVFVPISEYVRKKERDEKERVKNIHRYVKFHSLMQKDCAQGGKVCQQDGDCRRECFVSSVDELNYFCDTKDQTCKPVDLKKTKPVPSCDSKKGIFAALVYDPVTTITSWKCTSFYKYLIDDNGDAVEGVCSGGVLNLNLDSHGPVPQDCTCPSNTVLAYNRDNARIGRCVKNKLLYAGGDIRVI